MKPKETEAVEGGQPEVPTGRAGLSRRAGETQVCSTHCSVCLAGEVDGQLAENTGCSLRPPAPWEWLVDAHGWAMVQALNFHC